jgi:glucose/arabinose dehydrogenase
LATPRAWRALCIVALLAGLVAPLHAGFNGLELIAANLGGITSVAQAPGDSEHFFVTVKDGLVWVVDRSTGQVEPNVYLNLVNELVTRGDGGLLSIAFDPNYQENGLFYVTATIDNGGIHVGDAAQGFVESPYTAQVRRYHVSADPLQGDGSTFSTIIQWVKPEDDHTGGWLGFSPDNHYLYVATGDGGGPNDDSVGHTPGVGNAQDTTDNLMGKILRLDVRGDDFPDDPTRNYAIPASNLFVGKTGDDEIFAYGLRSPWSASFDRDTGDFWLGDVGEAVREEVNFIAADSHGGQNFGWRLREGSDATQGYIGGLPPPANTHPVYDYQHTDGGGNPDFAGDCIIGGYVYRGPDPELQGQYVFADFVSGQFWMFDPADPYGTVQNITSLLGPNLGKSDRVTAFWEDAVGNLYVGTLRGNLFQLKTDAWLPGDLQGDGVVNGDDLAAWRAHFGQKLETGSPIRDANGDGRVDGADFLLLQRLLGHSVHQKSNAATQAVPEPMSALLFAVSACALLLSRRYDV